jgi:TetR/AcrR family transcriptional regulator, cholesterol catabolism regulator
VEERAKRIVMAAIELAEKGGFEGVRLRDVAAHADVALGTLYRRFRSKEDLLLAALELQMASLEQYFADRPLTGGAALDRVHSFFRITTERMCSRPHLARALVRAVVAGGPDLSQRVAAFHHRMEAMIARALRGSSGGSPPNELEQRVGQALVHVWFASLTGWAGGLHGVEGVVDDTLSAAELILDGRSSLAAGIDVDSGLPPHREHV